MKILNQLDVTSIAIGTSPITVTSTTLVSNLNSNYLSGAGLSTDTTFAANSDTLLPSQKAIKTYITSVTDAIRQGIDRKESVRLATTATLAVTYATSILTATTNGAISIDGVAMALNDRLLVKNQSTGTQNGIYYVSQVGDAGTPFKLTRATDADTSAKVTSGLFVFVSAGTLNASSGWVISTLDTITLDTTPIVFVQCSGAGQIIDGDALTKTGNTLNVNVDNTSIEVSSDALRIKALGITDAHVATANKDGIAATASMRTLGTGATQASAGNHTHSGYQTSDAFLTSIAALGSAADKMIYTTGVDTAAETAITAFGRSIIDDVDATAVRATLGLGGSALLAVGTAAGTVAAGNHTHTGVVAKYATNIGDSTNATLTVTHGLNTMDVTVSVRTVASTYDFVFPDIRVIDVNNISIIFASSPTTNQYRVVVTG